MRFNIKLLMKQIIYFVFIYMMVINFVCDFFHLPSIIRYLPDVFLPFFVIFALSYNKYLLKNKDTKRFFLLILFFLFHCILSNIINMQSFFYLFWGFRNLFRFLFIMLCAIIVFDNDDKDKIINVIHKLFIINFFVCLFQYFVLGYWGDAIGGTFRIGNTGGNSGLVFLIVIENTLNIINFLNKKCSFSKVLFSLLFSILIAVFAELKIVYVFLGLILFLSLLLCKFSFKTILIVCGVFIVFNLGFSVLESIDPNTAKMLNFSDLLEYAGGSDHGYSSEYDISRFRAFSQINEYFFMDNLKDNLFGYGLGNCDISSFEIFNSNFAKQYNDILHYTWFSHSMLYLETGIIGYLLYIMIFIYIIMYCFKMRKKDSSNFSFYNFMIILLFISIIMTWYNSILRNDISYFVYVVFSLSFVIKNKEIDYEKSMYFINAKSK